MENHVITPQETEEIVKKLPMSLDEIREWERWARENFRSADNEWNRKQGKR